MFLLKVLLFFPENVAVYLYNWFWVGGLKDNFDRVCFLSSGPYSHSLRTSNIRDFLGMLIIKRFSYCIFSLKKEKLIKNIIKLFQA